ncbi:MAG TPA: PKD domain-containing protein [Planctomycetota bacterium]|nr:PKD domain-containing protein [Planctomycetota bacterium]
MKTHFQIVSVTLLLGLNLFAATPPTPTISPNGGSFTAPVTVTLHVPPTANDPTGFQLRYTMDGSTPTATSTLFNPGAGLLIAKTNCTIKVKAFKGTDVSAEASATFTFTPPSQPQLRIMAFNIQLGGMGTDGRYDLLRTARYMANADIICINENRDAVPTIVSHLQTITGVQWYYRVFSTAGGIGNSVISRYDFTAAYKANPTPYKVFTASWTNQKAVGHAQLNINGTALNFFSTRIEYESQLVREKQLTELKNFMDGFAEPRIVAGDFNTNPGGTCIRWMTSPPSTGTVTLVDGSTSNISTSAWYDAWATAKSQGLASSYPENPNGNTHGGSRFDYVFISKAASNLLIRYCQQVDSRRQPLIHPYDPAVISSQRDYTYVDYGVRPSDHEPPVAQIQFTTGSVANQMPVVNAGSDKTITLPAGVTLTGTVTDDGLPNPPGAVSVSWSKVSGAGTVTFSAATALSTSATFSAAGTYVLRLTASDGALSGSDSVSVTVNPAPAPLPSPWEHRDVGATNIAGSASHNTGTFTISASGTDIYDSADAFHFVYQPFTGDGEIVANVTGIQNAGGTFSMAAVMFRESFNANSVHASMMVTHDGKAKFRRRASTGATTLSDGPAGAGTNPLPRWLKLIRGGNNFSAFTSPDGSTWTQIHTTQTVNMPATVYVGFMALRNDNAALCAATFTNVALRPLNLPPVISSSPTAMPNPAGAGQNVAFAVAASDPNGDALSYAWNFGDGTTGSGSAPTHAYSSAGSYTATVTVSDGRGGNAVGSISVTVNDWMQADVGAVGAAGSAAVTGGDAATINASGTDVYGSADAFRYVYKQLTGDGSIVAKVTSIQNTAEWAQAGVMMRESLAANSAHATMMVTRVDRAKFRRRYTAGGSTSSNGPGPGSGQVLPQWVKLERAGSTFKGYRSPDGVNWELIGTDTVNLPATVYVGVYSLSANNTVLGQAQLSSIAIGGSVQTASRSASTVRNSGDTLDLGVYSVKDKEKVYLALPCSEELGSAATLRWKASRDAALPKGLKVVRGNLIGTAKAEGTHCFTLRIKTLYGETTRSYRLTIGK